MGENPNGSSSGSSNTQIIDLTEGDESITIDITEDSYEDDLGKSQGSSDNPKQTEISNLTKGGDQTVNSSTVDGSDNLDNLFEIADSLIQYENTNSLTVVDQNVNSSIVNGSDNLGKSQGIFDNPKQAEISNLTKGGDQTVNSSTVDKNGNLQALFGIVNYLIPNENTNPTPVVNQSDNSLVNGNGKVIIPEDLLTILNKPIMHETTDKLMDVYVSDIFSKYKDANFISKIKNEFYNHQFKNVVDIQSTSNKDKSSNSQKDSKNSNPPEIVPPFVTEGESSCKSLTDEEKMKGIFSKLIEIKNNYLDNETFEQKFDKEMKNRITKMIGVYFLEQINKTRECKNLKPARHSAQLRIKLTDLHTSLSEKLEKNYEKHSPAIQTQVELLIFQLSPTLYEISIFLSQQNKGLLWRENNIKKITIQEMFNLVTQNFNDYLENLNLEIIIQQ